MEEKKVTKKKGDSEAKIQSEIVAFLQSVGVYCFSIPNEGAGKDAAIRTARLITMGLKPGAADLAILWPHESVTFLEVKKHGGKQSDNQKLFQAKVQKHGLKYFVVYSVEDVKNILDIQ